MRLRFRAGGLLIILNLPPLTSLQRRMLLAAAIALIINLMAVGFMMLFLRNDLITQSILRSEKMVALNLSQDEDVRKALELMENPRANQKRPRDSKILSTENSESAIKTIPDDLKNSRNVSVLADEKKSMAETSDRTASSEVTEEDRFTGKETVLPFLRQPVKSIMEGLTGRSEGTTSLGPTYELNTYRWEFAPYMLKWKNKMTDKWYQITSRLNFNPFAKLGTMQIYVKMNRSGQLLDSKVVEYDCDKAFVAPAYASVVNAFPLDPLPDGFPEDMLETTWTITITH